MILSEGARTCRLTQTHNIHHSMNSPRGENCASRRHICRNECFWVSFSCSIPWKKNVVLVFKRHAVIKQFCVFGRHLSGTETWFKSSVTHTNISLSWLILFLSSLSASSFLSMCPCVAYLSNQPQICEVMSLILFFVWRLLFFLFFCFYRIWKSSIEKSATNIRSL